MAPAVDRISNLPKNVTEGILMLLPIRDAARTSILSRKWKYEWNTLPQLVFDEDCVLLPKDVTKIESNTLPELVFDEDCVLLPKDVTKIESDRKRVEIVDQVFILHHGPIRTFKLSFNLERCGDIDRWIIFISRNGIKEFILDKWEGEYYKVSSCLYSCEEITLLELYRCTIVLPSSFKGFGNLTTLDLQYVYFSNNGLEDLLSICLLLEKLVLKNISGCDHLVISALKLVELELDVDFEDICFQNTPLLATLSISIENVEDPIVFFEAVCKLFHVFSSSPRIERLELHKETLWFFSEGDVPIKLPTAYQLKYLLINLDFEDMQQMLAALCIFRSSPILQKLSIVASSDESKATISVKDFWETQEDFSCFFSHLQILEVNNFTGTKSELKFVEFVLANAPVLEKAQITFQDEIDGEVSILRKMIQFRRISSKAEFVF